MDRCESWTIKKAKHWRIDAFELWYWRRLFRVPWTARRSSQSMLEKINTEYSLEGLLLKLQYFGHLMRGADSLGKTLMLGKIERKRRGWQRMTWLDGVIDAMDTSLSKLQETVKDREAWRAAAHGIWLRILSIALEKELKILEYTFVVQSLSHVRVFATPRTAARRLPCPSLSPGVCSNSCPLSQWYQFPKTHQYWN